MDDISKIVKSLRSRLGMSQQVFATEAEISISGLQNYESGKRQPGLVEIAKIFRVALAEECPEAIPLKAMIEDGIKLRLDLSIYPDGNIRLSKSTLLPSDFLASERSRGSVKGKRKAKNNVPS